MGLRLGEICALKWEDIDMISRTLHVNRTVQRLPVDTVHTSGSSQNNHTATVSYTHLRAHETYS